MLFSVLLATTTFLGPQGQAKEEPQGIAAKVKGFEKRTGLIENYLDSKAGHIYFRFAPPAKDGSLGEYIYMEGLAGGLGANDVGLDRQQPGATYVLQVRYEAGRVLFQVPNFSFRAETSNPDEVRAVKESFPFSILWAAKPAATDPDGSILVDVTSFIVRDAHDVARTLRNSGQKSFRLDPDRSFLYPANCLSFPENLELEAKLTFESDDPGPLVRQHTPDAQSLTLIQHHSFVKLPDSNYQPRVWDPRCGFFDNSYYDFAAPLDQPLVKHFLTRFRLQKLDPNAIRSKVKKPIVYYVDRGAPPEIRKALAEGAAWWASAFEEAGFVDAFKVEVLPEGVHPLDARYNVIVWTQRSTRGWSYGSPITDPRTGEIVKGLVNLDALRIRQDKLIFESLFGADATGTGKPNDPVQLALWRLHQLSAHELGHTLGLAHNFMASTYGRASVMDYPAPWIKVDSQGHLDASDAYGNGVGEWDKFAIKYGYSEFAPGVDEAAALKVLMQEGLKRGMIFLSDSDARAADSSHPLVNLWDNGPDPLAELKNVLQVRRIGLANFGEQNVRQGALLADLQLVLGPLYFYHRYQVESVAKIVGGFEYVSAVRGDGQIPTRPVAGVRQRQALDALLDCLTPATLAIPNSILQLIPPKTTGGAAMDEMFAGESSYAFDSLSAASAGADLVLGLLMNPARCARLVELHSRDNSLPSLEFVLSRVIDETFPAETPKDGKSAEIVCVVQRVVVTRLMNLADDRGPATVRAPAEGQLRRLLKQLKGQVGSKDSKVSDQASLLAGEIGRFLNRPLSGATREKPPSEPIPGMPIGSWSDGVG